MTRVAGPVTLSYAVVPREGPQSRLLVLLHGYGEPATDLTDRLHLIDPDGRFRVVVPDAPFERRGQAIWHRAMSARDEAEAQYLASLAAVDALLGEVGPRLGLPTSDAVVGGFSQGGGLAVGLLLGADIEHRPAAAFGVCSFPPTVRGFRVDRAAAGGRPYFLSSAREDRFAPIEVSRAGASLLRNAGLDLTYLESDGAHEMTDDAAAQIGACLGALDRGEHLPAGDLLLGPRDEDAFFAGFWDVVS